MRRFLFPVFIFSLVSALYGSNSQMTGGQVKIELTSNRRIVTRDLGKGLLLRVLKDRSVNHEDFGWIIEVVKKPLRKHSENLIYQNHTGSTADLSQVYAWHIGSEEFPNTRELKVKGHPLVVTIRLQNVLSEGKSADARFISGNIKIAWEWARNENSDGGRD